MMVNDGFFVSDDCWDGPTVEVMKAIGAPGCHSLTALFHFGYTTWKQFLGFA